MSAKDLLIQLFSLPRGEIIFQDYSCALKGLFSKYGRVFLAEYHICFYANLGGSKTKLVIKMDEVAKLEKKGKSDIEISVKDGHIYCFNSFADRDQVFNLMNALLTGQPVQINREPVVGEESLQGQAEESAVLENADVEVAFLDGKNAEGEQEICKLTFPFTLEKFYEFFIADDAVYSLLDHRQLSGDTDVQLSKWQPMEDNYGSFQRELKTVIKLVDVPFKDKSRLHKLQTHKKEEAKITLHSTSHTLDVPYGNYFQLEERWEVTPTEDNKSILRVFGWVVFTKSTIMKKTIVPRTIQGLKDDYEKWAHNVKQKLEQLAKPKAQQQGSKEQHEYEDSKNVNDYNILKKLKKPGEQPISNPKEKPPVRVDNIQFAALSLLIIIMLIQVIIINRQSAKLDHLEKLLLHVLAKEPLREDL